MAQYSSKSFPNLYCHQYEFAKWAAWTTVTLSILIKKENFANLIGDSPFVKGAFFFFSSLTFLSFLKRFYFLFFGYSGSLLLHLGFLWLLWVEATLPCGTQASHCGGFSHCGAWALATGISVVAAPGLSSCGWHTGLVAPWHVGSHRPGIKPVSLALQGGFLTLDHQGSPK